MQGHYIASAACLAAICLLGGRAFGQSSAAPGAPEPMIGLPTTGLEAGDIPAQQAVFSREQDWLEFWKAHSKAPAPLVDFSHWQIAAVFLGQKPNPGYGVHIILAVRRADEITISYTESRPAPGMMYAQMIVYPYDLVAVPAGARITFQLARTGPAQKSQAAEAPVRALDMTGFSPPTQARYVAFTDEAQWDAFWRSHGRCPAPKVAFQEEMVIGLLQPDDAPAVRLAGAQKVDNEVRLKLVSGSPEAGGLRSFLAVVPRANRVDLAWTRSSP
jgi:hypothetical protein